MADRPDKSTLIDALNVDLAHEYQAVLMYNSFAALVSGIHRPILREFFAQEVPEELSHAQFLAEKITALGGTPTVEPAPFELTTSTEGMLRMALEAETETIARYVERRQQAEDFGDFGLAADLDDILSDETRHKEETEKLLRGLSER